MPRASMAMDQQRRMRTACGVAMRYEMRHTLAAMTRASIAASGLPATREEAVAATLSSLVPHDAAFG
jgi:hypothetical protein